MALIDRKVNDWSQAVSSLDDKPKMIAADLKAAFDSNSNQLKPAINGIIDDLTSSDGAGNIGVSQIDGVNGETVQAVLAELAKLTKLESTNGAEMVGVNPINGIDGENVQAILQSLADNDFKFNKLFTSEGAGLVGVSPINGVSGETIQAMLQNLYSQMMEIETGDPNPAQYIKKTEKGARYGVASLDENGKVPVEQMSSNIPTLGEDGKIPEKQLPNNIPILGENGKIPEEQLPDNIPTLGEDGKITEEQLPDLTTIPTGAVMWYSNSNVPDGFLICDGSQVSRTTYSALFNIIGTTFGIGDGSSMFTLPNLINNFIKGSKSVGNSNEGSYIKHTNIGSSGSDYIYLNIYNQITTSSSTVRTTAIVSNNISGSNINTPTKLSYIQPPNITLLPCIKY